MAEIPPGEDKPRPDLRRARDIFVLYGAAIRNIHPLQALDAVAEKHSPRASSDSILTALCQLTAIRTGVCRAMISLIDEERQYILAEATCNQSLRPASSESAGSSLWLGAVSIPRHMGLCEQVLESDSEDATLVINDLAHFHKTTGRNDVQSAPDMHFYASTPLRSPRGALVGTVCIYDDKPRDDFSSVHLNMLRDFALTIVDYLDTYTLKDRYKRGELFTRGTRLLF